MDINLGFHGHNWRTTVNRVKGLNLETETAQSGLLLLGQNKRNKIDSFLNFPPGPPIWHCWFSARRVSDHRWARLLKQQSSKTEQTENGNFSLFSANGKRKWQSSVWLLQKETEKRKFAVLGQQYIYSENRTNGKRQLRFQYVYICVYIYIHKTELTENSNFHIYV